MHIFQSLASTKRENAPLSLRSFIDNVRQCGTKEAEAQIVQAEALKLQAQLAEAGTLSSKDKHIVFLKLIFIWTLGYDLSIGVYEVLNSLSNATLAQKSACYMLCATMLRNSTDCIRSIKQTLQLDLNSSNSACTSTALSALANMNNPDLLEVFSGDVERVANISNRYKDTCRAKAYSILLKIVRIKPDRFPASIWSTRFGFALKEETSGCTLIGLVNLLIGIIDDSDAQEWDLLVPIAIDCILKVQNREIATESLYYSVPCPWLQVKLLKLLQGFPPSSVLKDSKSKRGICEILEFVLTNTTPPPSVAVKQKRGESALSVIGHAQLNAEFAIACEAVALIAHISSAFVGDMQIRQIVALLVTFIKAKENHLRYLSVSLLCQLAKNANFSLTLRKYCGAVLDLLADKDINIKLLAVEFLTNIADTDNWQAVVNEFIIVLKAGTNSRALSTAILSQGISIVARIASNPKSHLDYAFALLGAAPQAVTDRSWFGIAAILTDQEADDPAIQFALDRIIKLLSKFNSVDFSESLLRLGFYVVGELGPRFTHDQFSREKLFNLMTSAYEKSFKTNRSKEVLISSLGKLLADCPKSTADHILSFLRRFSNDLDPEAQQRVLEVLKLYTLMQGEYPNIENVISPIDRKRRSSDLEEQESKESEKSVESSEEASSYTESEVLSENRPIGNDRLKEPQKLMPLFSSLKSPKDLWVKACCICKGMIYDSPDLRIGSIQRLIDRRKLRLKLSLLNLNTTAALKCRIEALDFERSISHAAWRMKGDLCDKENVIVIPPGASKIFEIEVTSGQPVSVPALILKGSFMKSSGPNEVSSAISALKVPLPIGTFSFMYCPAIVTFEKLRQMWVSRGSNYLRWSTYDATETCKWSPSNIVCILSHGFGLLAAEVIPSVVFCLAAISCEQSKSSGPAPLIIVFQIGGSRNPQKIVQFRGLKCFVECPNGVLSIEECHQVAKCLVLLLG